MPRSFYTLVLALGLLCSACGGGPFDINKEGGTMYVVEPNASDFIFRSAGHSSSPQLLHALAETRKSQVSNQRAFIAAFVDNIYAAGSSNPASLFAITNREKYKVSMSKEEFLKTLQEEYGLTIDRIEHIIDHRLEVFGIPESERKVYKNKEGRIVIEVGPEVKPERLRKLIQASAEFGFYETYENKDIFTYIDKLNRELGMEMNPGLDTVQDTESEEYQKMKNPLYRYLQPDIMQQGRGEYVFSKGCRFGFAKISDTATINEMLKSKTARQVCPWDMHFLWSQKPESNNNVKNNDVVALYAIKAKNIFEPALPGRVVVDAQAKKNEQPGSASYVVSMNMNAEGAQDWERITKANLDRAIAMVIDGRVISAPIVIGVIPNGQSEISGNFTLDEAGEMAAILKSGSLPVHTTIIDEQQVTPKK